MASKSDIRRLEYTLGAVALFSAFVIYNSDPSGFGPFEVDAVAYFAAVGLVWFSLSFFSQRTRRTYLLMVVLGTAAVLSLVYVMTSGNGLPEQGDQLGLSCTTTTTTQNLTAVATVTSCTNTIPYFDYLTVLWNALFWLPLIGAIIYAMPSWIDPGRRNAVASWSRVLVGSVVSGTLLLLTFGLDNPSAGYPELFNGKSPLNPFVAYSYCNSETFGMVTCTQVNALYYSIDYAFWVAVVILLVMTLSELTDVAKKRFAHENGVLPAATDVGGADV